MPQDELREKAARARGDLSPSNSPSPNTARANAASALADSQAASAKSTDGLTVTGVLGAARLTQYHSKFVELGAQPSSRLLDQFAR